MVGDRQLVNAKSRMRSAATQPHCRTLDYGRAVSLFLSMFFQSNALDIFQVLLNVELAKAMVGDPHELTISANIHPMLHMSTPVE